MPRFHKLGVYHLAQTVLKDCVELTSGRSGVGDLSNQIRRAAVSVVSNICEGCGTGSEKAFVRYLVLARASANELQGQLEILTTLGQVAEDHPVHDRCDHVGRCLTALIRRNSG